MTMDVDLSLLTGFGEEEDFVDELLRHYAGRLPDTKNFALQNRVLLLRHSSGVGIDIALEDLDLEELIVVYPGERSFELGKKIRAVSLESAVSQIEAWKN